MKRKYTLKFFDILVLIALVFGIVLFKHHYSNKEEKNENNIEIYYTITVNEVLLESADKILAADTVYTDSGKNIGKVEQVIIDSIGEGAGYSSPSLCDVILKISCEGNENERSYLVDGCEIAIGKTYSFYTQGFEGVGKCTSMQTGEKQ